MPPYIHPNAIVESENIGDDTRIWAFVHVLNGAIVGRNCNICDHCFIENDVIVGDNVTIKSGVYLWDGVRLEDNVFLGPNVTFTNDMYPRSKAYQKKYPHTIIRDGASVGAGSVMRENLAVGCHAMIGAGSVVTKNVKDFELVYGNPATHRGYICKCKNKLDFREDMKFACDCGSVYLMEQEVVSQI